MNDEEAMEFIKTARKDLSELAFEIGGAAIESYEDDRAVDFMIDLAMLCDLQIVNYEGITVSGAFPEGKREVCRGNIEKTLNVIKVKLEEFYA